MAFNFPIGLSRGAWRLRYWSLRQLAYDLLYQPPDVIGQVAVEELWTVLTGHVNARFFHAAGAEFPELKEMSELPEESVRTGGDLEFVLAVAELILEDLEKMGTEASGFLTGYVREAKRNLFGSLFGSCCPSCLHLVGQYLQEEGQLAAALDTLKAALAR